MKSIFLALTFSVMAGGAAALNGTSSASTTPLALDLISIKDISGSPFSLKDRVGKVLLIVNVASKCGFTSQYEGLEALHRKFSARGLVVLGVPSNDFGGQEPGTPEEIKSFCTNQYGVSFPILEKSVVKGNAAHPLFQALAPFGTPKWNFHKYLVSRDRRQVESFGSSASPESLEPKILEFLGSQ